MTGQERHEGGGIGGRHVADWVPATFGDTEVRQEQHFHVIAAYLSVADIGESGSIFLRA